MSIVYIIKVSYNRSLLKPHNGMVLFPLARNDMQSLVIFLVYWYTLIYKSGNTKGGSIIVQLTYCLTGLDWSVLQIKTKIVSCHTAVVSIARGPSLKGKVRYS